MSEPIKIAVVGDGPIGNLVVAKLLIEHGKHNNGKNNIEITHLTSKRVATSGYSRRHILFITEELVAELEKNVLACERCLINIKNEQILTEDSEDGQKFLFSTRLLEQILLDHIKDNSDTYCNADAKCTFQSIVSNDKTNYYDFHYVFFAIGSNAAKIRETYFYSDNKYKNVKIKAPQADPIVAFYSDLGTPDNNITNAEMMEDKNSKIQLITKEELQSNDINIYDLEKFVTIIYNFYDKIEIFLNRYIYRYKEEKTTDHFIYFAGNASNNDIFFTNLPEKIQTELRASMFLIKKLNISLYGYDNYNSFINKFANAIYILRKLFNLEQDNIIIRTKLFNAYIDFLVSENMRPPTNDESLEWYKKIINNESSIIDLLNNYINFIYKYLKNVEEENKQLCELNAKPTTCPIYKKEDQDVDVEEDYKAICAIKLNLPKEYADNYKCLQYNFLVNIVQQSLDCFGIYNNELAYAAKKRTTNFFMIGDMANAYPAGISVEIGINFVNYIIPMFYNFYINNIKTIADCSKLNIVEILDDLLSDKYNNLLLYETNISTGSSFLNFKTIIQVIRNYYNDNLKVSAALLCDNNDIFLTYYNIVLLIQFVKNVDLILKNKKIIAISKEFKPRNYKIMNNTNITHGELEQFPKREGGRKNSKRGGKLKF
jgi:hypothetical protein